MRLFVWYSYVNIYFNPLQSEQRHCASSTSDMKINLTIYLSLWSKPLSWSGNFQLLTESKFHYHVHKSPFLDSILDQTDLFHITVPYFFKTNFKTTLPCFLHSFGLTDFNIICLHDLFYACYILRPSNISWFYNLIRLHEGWKIWTCSLWSHFMLIPLFSVHIFSCASCSQTVKNVIIAWFNL
jgi:hypothetical protein